MIQAVQLVFRGVSRHLAPTVALQHCCSVARRVQVRKGTCGAVIPLCSVRPVMVGCVGAGVGEIPGGATLDIEVELLSIKVSVFERAGLKKPNA